MSSAVKPLSLADRLLDEMGGVESLNRNSKLSKQIRAHGVVRSAELRRVLLLPRRSAETDYKVATLVTNALKLPGGTETLNQTQALMFAEAKLCGGLFAMAGVGFGKTWSSPLYAAALEAECTVLLIPPQLRHEVYEHLALRRKNFRVPKNFHVVAYSELSSGGAVEKAEGKEEKTQTILDKLKPTLIIADECHLLKNVTSARTKRFRKYFQENPTTKLVAMSGTVTSKSIKDYWHLIMLCLPGMCPLPRRWKDAEDWSRALDPRVEPELRMQPGALLELCSPEDWGMGITTEVDPDDPSTLITKGSFNTDDTTAARRGYRRRMVETPGVVATEESSIGNSICLTALKFDVPQIIKDALNKLLKTWSTPEGDEITEAVELYRHARELACGFYYKWVWPIGTTKELILHWLGARKAWREFVRDEIRRGRKGLDTELMIANAVDAGDKGFEVGQPLLSMWRAMKAQIEPDTQAVWLSDYAVVRAVQWGEEEPGIIWYEQDAFGVALKFASDFPLYAGGDAASLGIKQERGTRTVIASGHAHGTGKNLQKFHRALETCCPPNGARLEQRFGRIHRPGQEADEVVIDLFMQTEDLRDAFWKAMSEARYIQDTTGSKQKLLFADKVGFS